MGQYTSGLLYVAAFLLTTINAAICGRRLKKTTLKKRTFWKSIIEFLFVFYPVIILYGFRYMVGADYASYLAYFNYIEQGGEPDFAYANFEPGYVFITIVATILFEEGYGITIINGIVIFALLYMNVRKETNMTKMSFGIYIFLMVYFGFACNGVRQTIAALIVLYGYQYVMKGQFKKFVGCLIIAALFHKSALFVIVFYFLGKCRTNRAYTLFKVMACALGIGVIILKNEIYTLMSYTSYGGNIEKLGAGIEKGLRFLLYVVPTLILVEFFKSGLMQKRKEYNFLILVMYLQIPFQCMGVYNPVLERAAVYCSIAQVILVPQIIAYCQGRNRRIAKIAFGGWYLFYFIVMEIVRRGNGIANYQIWG